MKQLSDTPRTGFGPDAKDQRYQLEHGEASTDRCLRIIEEYRPLSYTYNFWIQIRSDLYYIDCTNPFCVFTGTFLHTIA